jgi:predicted ATPase
MSGLAIGRHSSEFSFLKCDRFFPRSERRREIDEPEVSLHPELLKLLADVMREAAKQTQLIVATHSDRLIRFLEPNEVLVCDAEDGLTTMTWADKLNLEKWLEDYSLDELWAMNVIGGRP